MGNLEEKSSSEFFVSFGAKVMLKIGGISNNEFMDRYLDKGVINKKYIDEVAGKIEDRERELNIKMHYKP
ncbi:MAG: hypothetical protein V1888_01080 [archaeon]